MGFWNSKTLKGLAKLQFVIFCFYSSGHVRYCRDHYDDTHCDKGCNTAPCGWDGSDCVKNYENQNPNWAKGTLVLHTAIPYQGTGPFKNSSLLWALSILLQTSVKLRGVAPLQPSADFFAIDEQQLIDLLEQAPNYKSNR